jgi:hypothetical protein
MDHLRQGGQRRSSPQLPAFCRSRRPITTTVRVSTLQQLLWLLWLVLAIQLSTLLLLLAGPVPPRLGAQPAAVVDAIAYPAPPRASSVPLIPAS